MRSVDHFISGKTVKSGSGRFSDIYNPNTGEVQAQVGLANDAEVDQAVEAAKAALPGWMATNPQRRARILFKFKDLLEQNIDELAELLSAEHGKVVADSKGDVQRGIDVVEFACCIPHLQKGEYTEGAGPGIDVYSMRQPLGVCAGITPFNFPAMIPCWMFAVAVACGNTFVLKPSEKDPSASMLMAELLAEAGLPEGVFNVVHGNKEAVDVLLTDERVQAVSFVGSTPIAESIYAKASAHGKRCQALGGAKNHMVIMPDADPDQVVNSLMGAAYGSAGERCMATSVAVCVGDEVADHLIARLKEAIDEMQIGPGTDTDTDPEPHMGPLVTREHRQKVIDYIGLGVEEGAELVVDGRSFTVTGHENGYFVGPTLFDRVTADMRIYKEEIFGPVLAVVRADNFDDALRLVNGHEYANGTSIFTRDGDTARQFEEHVQVGMVGINVPIPVPMAFHCFGGWKRSLFGPLHMYGPDGVRFFTRMKSVTRRWPSGIHSTADFSMPTMK